MEDPIIVFEDDSLLVLSKPSGWVVNYVKSALKNPILENWLSDNYNYETAKDEEFRSGIVHRLDKETSGVIVVAKTKDAFVKLQGQFKERIVKKTYIALVHGKVDPGDGVISAPVGRLPWRRDRFGVLAGGKNAETSYKSVENFKHPKYKDYLTLLDVMPRTGRTHQIRIHMKHLGYPVVSDEFYAGRKTAKKDRGWCTRLFLHAKSIEITHPMTAKILRIDSNLPGDLQEVINHLEKLREN